MKNDLYACLWFDGKAKEAAEFYCGIFADSKITSDTPMVINFELKGKKFMALNGGPIFTFNEAVSFVVECETQEEIDHYWQRLTEGGSEGQCGWLKDKFGLSWQIVPTVLGELMSNPKKAPGVMQALRQMKKFDIEKLKHA